MANPYATPSLGTRWTDKQATTLARLNIARIQADYNTYALQQILDPDNPANGLSAGALLQGFALQNVNYTSSAIDAHKIVPFFLDEPAHVSPTFNWQRAIRQTSWYAELGAPPVHGAFVIDASQNAVSWIDLDSATLAVYMTFNMASSGQNMIGNDSDTVNDIAVRDFTLYVATGGANASWAFAYTIDFLMDRALGYYTSGIRSFPNDISGRNTAGTEISLNSSPAIVNNVVNSIAICRDPSGGTDHFGRPLHYWLVNTSATANPFSLYSPIDNAIYDGGDLGSGPTADALPCLLTADGIAGGVVNLGGNFYNWFGLSVDGVSADGWETYNYFAYGGGGGGSTLLPWNGTAESKGIAAVDNGTGGKVFIIGSTEGLMLVNLPNYSTSGHKTAGLIWLTSTYATPYMKNTRVAAYPLDSVTDRSGNSRTLTNTTTVTFTSGVFGNAATFNGTNQYLSITGLSVTVQDPYIACIYTSTTSTNPSDWEYICIVQTSGGDYFVLAVRYDSTGKPSFTVSDDSGSSQDEVYGGPDVCDGNPHQIVGFSDGDNWIIAVDGIQVASVARSNAAGSVDITAIHVGASYGGGSYFLDGQVEMLSIGDAKLTMDEVALEYQRMQAALAGFTTLLTADDIDSVQVAPDGEYAIVTAGDVAHIMDPRTGIILSTDAVGAGTLNDAAIWQKDGSETPSYLLGASTTVEAVQPNEKIGER